MYAYVLGFLLAFGPKGFVPFLPDYRKISKKFFKLWISEHLLYHELFYLARMEEKTFDAAFVLVSSQVWRDTLNLANKALLKQLTLPPGSVAHLQLSKSTSYYDHVNKA